MCALFVNDFLRLFLCINEIQPQIWFFCTPPPPLHYASSSSPYLYFPSILVYDGSLLNVSFPNDPFTHQSNKVYIHWTQLTKNPCNHSQNGIPFDILFCLLIKFDTEFNLLNDNILLGMCWDQIKPVDEKWLNENNKLTKSPNIISQWFQKVNTPITSECRRSGRLSNTMRLLF